MLIKYLFITRVNLNFKFSLLKLHIKLLTLQFINKSNESLLYMTELCLKPYDSLSWFGPGWQQRTMWSIYRPFPRWGGEENRKKKAKLVGWDKDFLTEQRRKQTVITIISRIYKTREYAGQFSSCPTPRILVSCD